MEEKFGRNDLVVLGKIFQLLNGRLLLTEFERVRLLDQMTSVKSLA